MADPPVGGAVQLTVAVVVDEVAVATTAVGAPGTLALREFEAAETVPTPTPLVARTVKV